MIALPRYELKVLANPADAVSEAVKHVGYGYHLTGPKGGCDNRESQNGDGGGFSPPDPYSDANIYRALMYACEHIFTITGGCPMDIEGCQFPAQIDHCTGMEEDCWRHYFIHQYGRTHDTQKD